MSVLRTRVVVVLFSVLVLGACNSGDRSTRSPALPADTLNSFALNCAPTTLAVGQTGQCTATCDYRRVNSDGSITISPVPPGACEGLVFASGNPTIVSIDGGGTYTGESPGSTDVRACVEDGDVCETVTITVSAACPVAGVAPVILPASQNLPPNARSQLQANVTFTDGSTVNVAQQPGMNWSVPAQAFVSICNTNGGCGAGNGKGTVSALTVGGPVTVTGTYTQANCAAIPDGTATVTVVPATIIAGGLCIEPVTATRADFSGCRADTGACLTDVPTPSIPVGGTQQFRARGRFNDGQECSLTQTTTWSSSNTAIFTVNNTGLATGVAAGTANAVGVFSTETDSHPLTVFNQLVLGNNSLEVGVPIDSNMDNVINASDSLGKFFCIGYADLVGGLADSEDLPGSQQLQANARFCAQNTLVNGACPPAAVTPPAAAFNARTLSNWVVSEGFWAGNDCSASTAGDPTGMNESPAQVGNTFTVAPPVDNKGLVTPRGSVRLGTACVRATFVNPLNPANSDFDGATALVLPVTNDVLLQDDQIAQAVELCNTLAPLFLLGGANNGGAGAVTDLVSSLSEILNPVLTALTQGNEPGGPIPTDDIVDSVAIGLSDAVTAMLFEAGLQDVVDTVNGTVYAPLNCALGALLNALASQDPNAAQAIQSCPPDAGGLPGLPIP